MKTRLLLCSLLLGPVCFLNAAPLTQSTFTEVVRDVSVVTLPANTATPAQVNEVFKVPNVVRTGSESRAELTAPDQTITRVGANTAFSFAPDSREINLERGSVLFHSPSGKGGGTIKSGGASAAVLGTTLIVVATPGGGFKVILLEGKGRVTLKNGHAKKLKAGQLIFVLPGHDDFGPLLDINLAKLVGDSKLVNGFSQPLVSLALINAAIQQQQKEIASGRAEDTGVSPDKFVVKNGIPLNGLDILDNNTYQAGVLFPLVEQQQQILELLIQNNGDILVPPPVGGNTLPPPLSPPPFVPSRPLQ